MHKTITIALLFGVLSAVCIVQHFYANKLILNVSAIETALYIGVYWNENCSQPVDSIDWGVLTLGQTKTVITYVRNEGNKTWILMLKTENWNPLNASKYLRFHWSSSAEKIKPGETTKTTLELTVNLQTAGISNFSFNIVFEASEYLPGDINKDGQIDIYDVVIVSAAYNSKPGVPNWNPDADVAEPFGIINIHDVVKVTSRYGEKYP